jgi:hypothetical protein
MATVQPASYSFTWAEEVIKRLRAKHARATSYVEGILAIDDKILARYLAKRDPLWVEIRNLIRNVGKKLEKPLYEPTESDLYFTVIMYVQSPQARRLKNRLTACGFSTTLKEPVKQMGLGGVLTDKTLPFVLEVGNVQYTLFELV